MERKKFLPIYISCALAAALFVAFIFIPVGGFGYPSVFETLRLSAELGGVQFALSGSFMIAHIAIVAACFAKCAAVGAMTATGRANARAGARSFINTVAISSLFIGLVSVATGVVNELAVGTGRYVLFAVMPVEWVYFGIGVGVLIVSAINGAIVCANRALRIATAPRAVALILSAAAFAVSCAFVPDLGAMGDVTYLSSFILRVVSLAFSFLLFMLNLRALAANVTPKSEADAVYVGHGAPVTAGIFAFVTATAHVILSAIFDWSESFVWYSVFAAITGAAYIVFVIGCGVAHVISAKDSSRAIAHKTLGIGSASFFIMLSVGGTAFGGLGYAMSAIIPACVLVLCTAINTLCSGLYNSAVERAERLSEEEECEEDDDEEDVAPVSPSGGAEYMRRPPDYSAINMRFPAYYALQRIDVTPFTPREAFTHPDLMAICADIAAYAARSGMPLSARTVRSVVAGLATSPLVYIVGDAAAADSAVRAVGSVFGGGYGTETILEGDRTDSLLGRYNDRGFMASGFIVSLYSALKNREELRAVTVAGVMREESSFILPQVSSYACDPIRRRSLVLCDSDVADSLVLVDHGRTDITKNVRFVVAAASGGVVSAAARYGAAAVRASSENGVRPSAEPAEIHMTLSDWNALVSDALSSDSFPAESEWKKTDRLEDALGKIGLRSDNKRTRMLERYVSVYIACGGSEEEAIDSGICAVILPRVTLLDREKVRAAALADVMDGAFGPDALPQCREFLRSAGLV